ncbi:hypothetical protein BBF96_13780 [Anoxybacter fermentans]|uniref:DUF1232 domain-containing protein n=1 Tax=Anoxybacter fermentans TaxID=1323375 RepID=A0A3S9T194_9FIRM|nr:DUF1232 domain-containing protein [Anoxybacter fermentans]AZR74363.1 hypothetical protein BBF96_13780 [Anoxybacter fermentans]
MKEFTENEILKFLGRLANEWGTGHESVTKILGKIKTFLDKKKEKIKFLDKVYLLVEMLEAWSEKKYVIDDETLGLIIACLAYLILPIDLIPDFIIAVGFTDDAAAFALVFNLLSSEIERFKAWKANELQIDEVASSLEDK